MMMKNDIWFFTFEGINGAGKIIIVSLVRNDSYMESHFSAQTCEKLTGRFFISCEGFYPDVLAEYFRCLCNHLSGLLKEFQSGVF
jgi:hypothetical protein